VFIKSVVPILTEASNTTIQSGLQREILDAVKNALEPVTTQIKTHDEKILKLEDEIKALKDENKTITAKLIDLESSNEDLEQHSRRNSVRFYNVPLTSEQVEDTDSVIYILKS